MIVLTGKRGWTAAVVAGGALAVAALAFAAKTQKRAPATVQPDWATHSAYAEQSAAAYFD